MKEGKFDFIDSNTTPSEIVNHFQGAGNTTSDLIRAVMIYGELKHQEAKLSAAEMMVNYPELRKKIQGLVSKESAI